MIDRMDLLLDLQRAIERGELVLHFQPTVNLSTGVVSGVEALVRWDHPTRGLLLPSDFIPIAEESDIILSIGSWVLRTACVEMKRWQSIAETNTFSVSVNVSARQLEQKSFPDEVRRILNETGVDAGRLVLEVTETLMIKDVAMTIDRLQQLKAIGVRLAIDDFGTGYSSLSYLSQFPFDILKIDKSFIDGAGAGDEEQQLVPAIIDLGKMLNMQTVAEGIERPEQVARLRVLDCDFGQGFLFARPVEATAIDELLRAPRRSTDAA
jgi:EAL domain-containing protein (putative c-di-GMP-specific phosphodiesterase class I)